MALDADKRKQLEALKDDPELSPEVRTLVLEQLAQQDDESLQGWAKAGGTKADSAPTVPGELGVKGIIGSESTPAPGGGPVYDTEFGPPAAPPSSMPGDELIGKMDARYDLVPQILSMTPATTDPEGDRAAEGKWRAGAKDGPVTFVYEPPVSLIQKQLVENPAFLRKLRPSDPPAMEEITQLTEDSPLYQDAANDMWRQTAEAATKNGRTVYRYSQAPWLWDDDSQGVLNTLALKVGGAMAGPVQGMKDAFVLGVDDTGAFGAARAAQEAVAEPRVTPDVGGTDVMGKNEAVGDRQEALNDEAVETHPVAYGAGQVLGALAPWGAVEQLYQGVMSGGRYLATKLGATAAPKAAQTVGAFAGRVGANVAAGTATTAGQEVADAVGRAPNEGRLPTGDEAAAAGQRVLDTLSPSSAGLAVLGEGGASLAHAGANVIRDSDRFSGRLRAAEPHLSWGPTSVGYGPTLGPELKDVTRRAAREGKQPGDYIAKEIAPAIEQEAAKGVKDATDQAGAARRNYQNSPEGQKLQPASHLQFASLEKLRDHHQPQPGGGLRAVDNKYRDHQRVFSSLAKDISTEPVEGALELSADEAGAFLNTHARRQLLMKDLAAAAELRGKTPTDRAAYLQTVDPKKRVEVDAELDAAIADLLPEQAVGDQRIDERSSVYKQAEQQALRERVDEEMVLEPFAGSFAGYLKQRGLDTVYVTPHGADARRTDTLIKGLKDKDLSEAAEFDRQKFTRDGERGGYYLLRKEGDKAIAEATDIRDSVAPGGKAFEPIARTVQSRPGEMELVDRVEKLADQAGGGTRQKYDRLRVMQDAQEIAGRSRFRGRQGESRNVSSPQNWADFGQLRALSMLRPLEGALGPVGGPGAGALGRAPLVTGGDAGYAPDDSARGRYERARDKRLAEIKAEREKRASELERRKSEPLKRRR